MKLLAIVAFATFITGCVPRAARVQTQAETTASGPACKEIVEEGKPARCEAVAPSVISDAR
ncbi:MAG: hypothetical protein ACKV2T_35755 [Kofleriaceae bacterium]